MISPSTTVSQVAEKPLSHIQRIPAYRWLGGSYRSADAHPRVFVSHQRNNKVAFILSTWRYHTLFWKAWANCEVCCCKLLLLMLLLMLLDPCDPHPKASTRATFDPCNLFRNFQQTNVKCLKIVPNILCQSVVFVYNLSVELDPTTLVSVCGSH